MTSLYLSSDLSSNSLSSLLQSLLSDLAINNLAHDTKLVVRSRLFDPAVFIYTATEVLNRDKEFTLRNIHYEYSCNMLKKGKETLSWEPFYDFLDKKQILYSLNLYVADSMKLVSMRCSLIQKSLLMH